MAKKILIIDDSALMRRVISDIIKTNKQYEVADFARDGLEGFDRIVAILRCMTLLFLTLTCLR